MPGLSADELARCVRAVVALGKDLDATSIAEALWLAAEPGGTAESDPSPVPHVPTAKPQPVAGIAEEPSIGPGSRPVLRPGRKDAGTLMPGRPVRVTRARPFPQGLEFSRSLRPFKRRWLRGQRLQLDIDATVAAYTRTWQLVPTFSYAPERWFDVSLVVDDSPSMAIWAEEVAGLSRVLRQAGTFKTVNEYRLSFSATDGSQPSLRPVARTDRSYRPGRLRAPDRRGLIIVVTDGAARDWHHPPAWRMVRGWAAATPTVAWRGAYWPRTASM